MMYNLIIKKISYSHCLVICIFLFLSCGQSNQFKKDSVRHVYNFADERNSEVLIEYLQNESDEIREHACLLFGSMNSKDAIGPLFKILNSDVTLRVDIGGHTDNAGTEEGNVTLSHDRAKAVNDYLISKGIAHERLTYEGYGSSKPVNKNISAADKAQNRRTELNLRNY